MMSDPPRRRLPRWVSTLVVVLLAVVFLIPGPWRGLEIVAICGAITNWQLSRLFGRRGLAVPSSIASSPASISGVSGNWSSRT